MKLKSVSLFATVVFIGLTLAFKANAVQKPDLSNQAKVVVAEENKPPKTYNFHEDDIAGEMRCIEDPNQTGSPPLRTEIYISNIFDERGGTSVSLTLSIEPSGAGTFYIVTNNDTTPKASATVQIHPGDDSASKNFVDVSENKKVGGTVTIENYPASVGGFIKGTLDVTLVDIGSEDSEGNTLEGNLAHITGEFYIKRIANTVVY